MFNKDYDLAFCLEVLSLLVSYGDEESFKFVVKKTLPLIAVEEDFQFLLSECEDFYHRLDQENVEAAIAAIAFKRKGKPLAKNIDPNDTDFFALKKLIS
jgi:hypothetical protein